LYFYYYDYFLIVKISGWRIIFFMGSKNRHLGALFWAKTAKNLRHNLAQRGKKFAKSRKTPKNRLSDEVKTRNKIDSSNH